MTKDTELSAYELGIIQNFLRGFMVSIEEFNVDLVTDDEAEMKDNIDKFSAETMSIEEKVKIMIDKKVVYNYSLTNIY